MRPACEDSTGDRGGLNRSAWRSRRRCAGPWAKSPPGAHPRRPSPGRRQSHPPGAKVVMSAATSAISAGSTGQARTRTRWCQPTRANASAHTGASPPAASSVVTTSTGPSTPSLSSAATRAAAVGTAGGEAGSAKVSQLIGGGGNRGTRGAAGGACGADDRPVWGSRCACPAPGFPAAGAARDPAFPAAGAAGRAVDEPGRRLPTGRPALRGRDALLPPVGGVEGAP